jgi:hypothetical protein
VVLWLSLRTREAREVLSAGVTRPPEAARREGMANAHFDMFGCARERVALCSAVALTGALLTMTLTLSSSRVTGLVVVARASLPD